MKIEINEKGISPFNLLKLIDRRFNYVAQDKKGHWFVYANKPRFNGSEWISNVTGCPVPSYFMIDFDGSPIESLHSRSSMGQPRLFKKDSDDALPKFTSDIFVGHKSK